MTSSRFFVANLPPNTTEQDLIQLFQDYGKVERVELKFKENPLEPASVKVIAFVTLKLTAVEAEQYVNDLNWQTIKGAKIKVSLAKESFLDRLKREREETELAKGTTGPSIQNDNKFADTKPRLLRKMENTRKVFGENDLNENNDDGIEPDSLITKKRATNSLYNGKIVIQAYDTTPIHVIETQKKKLDKELPKNGIVADKKRKESLNKLKNQYKQKKSAIQHALAGLDSGLSKKIKFSDAEDDAEESEHVKPKMDIFESDGETNEDDNTNLNLKSELFSKKGEKLLQMQSRQSLDPRFRIDATFVDDDDNESVHNDGNVNVVIDDGDYKLEDEADNERNWQFGILEQVVGTNLDNRGAVQMQRKDKNMLRFDPAKEGHQKLLRTSASDNVKTFGNVDLSKKKNNKLKAQSVHESADLNATTYNAEHKVSKEVFYMVTDTLAQSLKSRGDGFSLLNMFDTGTNAALEQREDELKKVHNAKILVNKLDKNPLHPFSYDSSSDSETGIDLIPEQVVNEIREPQDKSSKQKPQPVKVVMESFFIPRNDMRLKEGAKFFRFDKKQIPEEDYEQVRNRLKLLIRSKISKTKKNMMFRGNALHKRNKHYK